MIRTLFTAICLLATTLGYPNDVVTFNDLMGGFEDDAPETPISALTNTQTTPLSFDGSIDFELVLNTGVPTPPNSRADFSGLAHSRIHFKPEISYRSQGKNKAFISIDTYYNALFDIKSDDTFSQEYINDSRSQIELGKTYYSHTEGNLDFSVGRQIKLWGEAESVRVVDVINPIDSREPGLVDLENLRLPVGSSFISYYQGDWTVEAGMIWEFRPDKIPAFGSDYSSLTQAYPDVEEPSLGEDLQYTLSLKGNLNDFDVGFYYANALQHQAVFDAQKNAFVYPDFSLIGASLARVKGSWLMKSEIAYLSDQYANGTSIAENRLDWMIGAEYYGSNNKTVAVEYAQRRYLGSKLDLTTADQTSDVFAIRYSQPFMHEKLLFNAFLVGDSFDEASILTRASLTYKPIDGLSFEAGGLMYQSDNTQSFINSIEKNDKVFFRVRHDF